MDVVDVEVAIGPRPPNLVGTHRDVVLDGRVVARRIAAHHSVVLGDGVKVIDGKFPPRAGSDARPQLLASTSKPVRLLVRHVPMALATTMHKLYGAKLRRKRSA